MATVLESPLAGLNLYETLPGPITFGYLDSTQYSGDLTWVPIDTITRSSWTASTVYYWIGDTPTESSAGQPILMGKQPLRQSCYDSSLFEICCTDSRPPDL